MTLKGNIEGELSHRFWRFKLKRFGKSYRIEAATPIGLPKTQQPQQVAKQQRQPKPKTEAPPIASQTSPKHKPRVFNLVNNKL